MKRSNLIFLLVSFIWSLCGGNAYEVNASSKPELPSIQFCGAAQMVGGSCCLIDTGENRVLIDFGLFYGAEHEARNPEVPFDPATISHVILTHAHIDHSGRLPFLYRKGFNGKVIATDATKSITGVMLEMSLGISEEQGTPIYSRENLTRTMQGFMTIPYDQRVDITSDMSVRLRDAGHIMGSAIVELWITGKEGPMKIVSTGDIGPMKSPLLRSPSIVAEGDYILIESTYGAVRRKQESFDEFGKDIQETIKAGGSVLVPAFVLEKTQKVIYVIGALKRKGIIGKDVPVMADSSTGREITKLYRKYTKYYNEEGKQVLAQYGNPLVFSSLYEVSGRASLRYHEENRPAIYLTSSGMLDHANAPKHLEKMIGDPKNLLAIVGWQAPDSLGRKLQDGARVVRITITDYEGGDKKVRYVEKPVRLRVKRYSQFSSHADGCDALQWLANIPKTKKVFVIHGDKENAGALAREIKIRLGFDAVAPSLGEMYHLKGDNAYFIRKQTKDVCAGLEGFSQMQTIADQ